MGNQANSWYIPGEGKQPVGPFTAEQLIQSWRAGKISEKALCWREGMTEWLPLSHVVPFASVMRSAGISSQIATDAARSARSPKRSKAPLIAVVVGAGVGVLAIVTVTLLMTQGKSGAGRGGGVATSDATGSGAGRTAGEGGAPDRVEKAINYFPDDTTEIVSFDIPGILESGIYRKFEKVFGGGPHRKWTLEEIEQWPVGASLSDVSRITFASWPAPGGEIMVVVLKRAFQPKEFVKNLAHGGDWAERDVGGYTLYSNKQEPKVCFFPDDHTVVVGTLQSHLLAVLDRKGPPKPSSRACLALHGVDFSHAVIRAQERGNYVPVLEEAILNCCGVTRLDVTLITGSLQSTAVYIDAGSNLQVAANWTCRDDESAKKVQISMDELLARARADEGASPLRRPDGHSPPITREARELLDSIRISRSGRTVILQISINEAFLDFLLSHVDISSRGSKQEEPKREHEDSRTTESTNNLRQIAQAMHRYGDANERFPARANFDEQGKPLLSWRVHLLPFLDSEAQSLYREFHLNEPWDSEHNRQLIPRMPKLFQNPGGSAQAGMANYLAVCGEGLAFHGKTGRRFSDFTDGTFDTILVVEVNDDHAVVWTKPDDWQYDAQQPLAGLGRAHPDGFNVLFAGGSVRLLPSTIAPFFFHALLTVAGGESTGYLGRLDKKRMSTTLRKDTANPASGERSVPESDSWLSETGAVSFGLIAVRDRIPGETGVGDDQLHHKAIAPWMARPVVLEFAVTKVSDVTPRADLDREISVVLFDDRGRDYENVFNVLAEVPVRIDPTGTTYYRIFGPRPDFGSHIRRLPIGFVYVHKVEISVYKDAVIKGISVGDSPALDLDKVAFTKLRLLGEYGEFALKQGQAVQVGRSLNFACNRIGEAQQTGWELPVDVTNEGQEAARAAVHAGVQYRDGTVFWGNAEEAVDGASKKVLAVSLLLPSANKVAPKPSALLLFFVNLGEDVDVFRIIPITEADIPPLARKQVAPPTPPMPPPPPSSGRGKKSAAIPLEESPSGKEAVGKGPLFGTWQTSTGDRFRIDDDGKSITVELEYSNNVQSLSTKLTRRAEKPKFADGDATVVLRSSPSSHTTKVTGNIIDENHLKLRFLQWPAARGGPGVLNILLARSGGDSPIRAPRPRTPRGH